MGMLRFIKDRIATKVSLYVNLILLVVLIIGSVYIITTQSKSLESQLLKRGQIESIIGAKIIGRIIEEAVDNGVFSINDAFDKEYVPIPGFDPPKYHTKYDFYLDKSILGIEDEFLNDESVVFAVAVDTNGYLPTHNTKYNQAPTGDREKDLLGNRTKRVFKDPVGIKAAKNTEKGFLQIYQRDTGVTMWDISSPIYVKGRHWGGFRIGFSLEKINAAKKVLMQKLIVTMLLILIISFCAVFFAVSRALSPIRQLTAISARLADGDIENKIKVESNDEVGRLADVLERLRLSLKAAMDRIKKK
jgi:methyl-accepting chemotaxis protein